ncbi:MAG: NACHT domain-containing protein [Cyanobacteria bacterium P01_F01_bin.116]
MPSIPRDFLEKVADQKRLTSFQKETFIERLANIDSSDLVIAKTLNISRDRYSSRMTQVYKKFNVPKGNIPGKAKLLFFEVLDMYKEAHPDIKSTSHLINTAIDDLVQEAKQKTQELIHARCGKMQILDMNRPMEVEDIFTEVKITDQISSKRRIKLQELVEKYEQLEKRNNTKFTIARLFEGAKISGVELIRNQSRLMILGRPGAGKTTFLKYVATFTNSSKILPNYFPIYISLKDFQDKDSRISLLNHIENDLSFFEISKELFHRILKASRVIFLFDGLDEVRKENFNRIVRQIKELSQVFSQSRFIITCRLAAHEYTFENFLEVEICEFTNQQINVFVSNWFKANQSPTKSKAFLKYLRHDKEISELATNPLLLTLLCLVFDELGEFPKNQTELYKEGLDILLSKWDSSRTIERPETYRKLSKNKKEALLAKIAYATFEKNKGLFKKETIETEIRRYIENLPRSINSPEDVEADCDSILTSMVAQHGLIVEVAKGIYSFSHRTFHEYFVALKILKTLDPDEQIRVLKALTIHIVDYRWQEVFLIASCMLENADFLVRLIKYEIDKIAEESTKIKSFMNWLKKKSYSAENTESSPIFNSISQVFYFNLVINEKTISRQKLSKDFILDSELMGVLHFGLSIQNTIGQVESLSSQEKIDEILNKIKQDYNTMLRLLEKCINAIDDSSIKEQLGKLKQQLPNNTKNSSEWWSKNGSQWIKSFRNVIIDHRNIGHNWRFTKAEIQSLRDYYNVNKLLSRCLKSDCYVSREVREEINLSTLLPIDKND